MDIFKHFATLVLATVRRTKNRNYPLCRRKPSTFIFRLIHEHSHRHRRISRKNITRTERTCRRLISSITSPTFFFRLSDIGRTDETWGGGVGGDLLRALDFHGGPDMLTEKSRKNDFPNFLKKPGPPFIP